jgi:hypothetical protein
MTETPLLRNGKIILRRVDHDDGMVTLKKPLPVKPEHIFKQTGAPGWDKRLVDQVFEKQDGWLEYVDGTVKYSIPVGRFRAHAYTSDNPIFGEQYHVEKQWYDEEHIVITEPIRSGNTIQGNVFLSAPSTLEFGKVLNCGHCKGTGKQPGEKTAGSCKACMGIGVIPWRPSLA